MLSVVAASRNDGHGRHLVPRMQVFIDGLVDQVERFEREVELILVDWNPPEDRPALAEVLSARAVRGFRSRVLKVPPELHSTLSYAKNLGFFQMIAKNVGLRRAEGEAVLATNIDILLSDALFLDSTGPLSDRCVYRTDRHDIPFDPAVTVDPEVLRRTPPLRINSKTGIYYPGNVPRQRYLRGPLDLARLAVQDPGDFVRRLTRRGRASSWSRYRETFNSVFLMPQLHLNACGDFTLMTRESWQRLRGYPEWEMFSWRLDGLVLYQAAAAAYSFQELPDHPAFHLDHSSGFSLESQSELFNRMSAQGIPVLGDAEALEVERSIWAGRKDGAWLLNREGWGYADREFKETSLPVRAAARYSGAGRTP